MACVAMIMKVHSFIIHSMSYKNSTRSGPFTFEIQTAIYWSNLLSKRFNTVNVLNIICQLCLESFDFSVTNTLKIFLREVGRGEGGSLPFIFILKLGPILSADREINALRFKERLISFAQELMASLTDTVKRGLLTHTWPLIGRPDIIVFLPHANTRYFFIH